ncbi:MAG: FecR family protein [Gammaproteobacteria bacterium]
MKITFYLACSAVLRIALLPLVVAVNTAYAETGATVGEVSLVLGKAYIKTGDKQERVQAGTKVKVSDQIITEANGHVHVRFVDDALVSVRPDSKLEIQRYDFDAANPSDSSIKLNLLEGITRSISGDGAHAARDRFRLNTPIAAIGVRGTDFVVSASDQSVRALVNEGAIIMAPFSLDCLAASFGPCATNAVELSQDSLQMLAIEGGVSLPRLLPATDERGDLANVGEVAVAETEARPDDKAVGTEVYLENVTSRRVAEEASIVASTPKPPVVVKPPVVILPDFTPDTAIATSTVASQNLVWGRWTDRDGQGAQERLSVAYDLAEVGREITIASDTYVLFRAGNGQSSVKRDLTVVNFALSSAQAFYHSNTGVVAMEVNSGSLQVDFGAKSFATQLGLSSAASGKVEFSDSGLYNSGGYFYNYSDTQNIRGAVSLDGTEAGYAFDKQLGADASIEGITLWGTP